MEQKKYLKWYNKVGYGSGDIAGNVVYAFLSSQYNNDVVKNDYLINKFETPRMFGSIQIFSEFISF